MSAVLEATIIVLLVAAGLGWTLALLFVFWQWFRKRKLARRRRPSS